MPKPSIGNRKKTKNSQERLAAALRENLKRRKDQARARSGPAHGENIADMAPDGADDEAGGRKTA